MMATRSGSLDPGILLHLMKSCGLTVDDLIDTLNHRCGLLGVSGISADMREIIAAADKGSVQARLAYDRFIIFARRAVGAMMGALGGIDLLIFTGGIGENNARVRHDIAAAVSEDTPVIDASYNEIKDSELDDNISASDGNVKVLVIHAREDLVVLREIVKTLAG